MRRLFDRRRPARIIQHPQYGQKLLQDGLLYFMDGTPFDPPKRIEETPPSPQHTDTRPTAQAIPPAENDPRGYTKMQWFKLKAEIPKLGGPVFATRAEALAWLKEHGHII